MCIFSGKAAVNKTSIFARKISETRQVLVYQMTYDAKSDLAMILPIPIANGTEPEFINLDFYPNFFKDLKQAYDAPHVTRGGNPRNLSVNLPVHNVGAYEASFVSDFAAFERLDERFKLSPGILESVPGYDKYGFVVFKLSASDGLNKVHPMAFEFESTVENALYYPTLHIHDKELHPEEDFDHALYAQGPGIGTKGTIFSEFLRTCMKSENITNIIDFEENAAIQKIVGLRKNEDTIWHFNVSTAV